MTTTLRNPAQDTDQDTGQDTDQDSGSAALSATVTVYFDVRPGMQVHQFRTTSTGRDPLGHPGTEVGIAVPTAQIERWQVAERLMRECLAEQQAVFEQIVEIKRPVLEAHQQRVEQERAQQHAVEQAALTEQYGNPCWILMRTFNEGRRGRTSTRRVAVHRVGCRRLNRYPDWRLEPKRLDALVEDVYYRGGFDGTTSKVHFCSSCVPEQVVQEIQGAVEFAITAHTGLTSVTAMLLSFEQFEAQATLLALQGREVTWRPSGTLRTLDVITAL